MAALLVALPGERVIPDAPGPLEDPVPPVLMFAVPHENALSPRPPAPLMMTADCFICGTAALLLLTPDLPVFLGDGSNPERP